jgi:hypothetical protein
MGSSDRGVVLFKNESRYVYGRFRYKTEQACKEFFTHKIFEHPFEDLWMNFRKHHETLLSKSEQKNQPTSMFLEAGVQIDLLDTKRDLCCRQAYRDFITSFVIHTISQLGTHDGFYDDVNSGDTWVYVDYVNKLIYVNGEKVFETGFPEKEKPQDTPMMAHLRKQGYSHKSYGIVSLALEYLVSPSEIISFYYEYSEWLEKYADLPEDRKDPMNALNRMIGYAFNQHGSSARTKWKNAIDVNYKHISLEGDKLVLVEIPPDFTVVDSFV